MFQLDNKIKNIVPLIFVTHKIEENKISSIKNEVYKKKNKNYSIKNRGIINEKTFEIYERNLY